MANNKIFGSIFNTLSLFPKPARPKGFPTIKACYPTGSRFICNPPPTDTDDDRVILVDEFPDPESMKDQGWNRDGDDKYASSGFESYRNGEKNYILVKSRRKYIQYVAATLVAKELNLTNKEDRINLFSDLQDNSWDDYKGPLPNKGLL